MSERDGRVPTVIDGEDLLADPELVVAAWCDAVGLVHRPRALTWDAGRAAGWEHWSRWTAVVERSSGLPVGRTVPRDGDVTRLGEPHLEPAARACLGDYRHLAAHRLRA